MASNRHTPGPWKVDILWDAYGNSTIRPDDGTQHGNIREQPIATVYRDSHAQLIAAAPELLEAAKEVLRQANEYRDMDRDLPVTGAGNPIDPLRRIVEHMNGRRD